MSSQGVRTAALKALTEIRRAQLRIRALAERTRELDRENHLRMLVIVELLERMALRLETVLSLGYVTPDLLKAPLVIVYAIGALRSFVPPDVRLSLSAIQEGVETIRVSAFPELRVSEEELRREAEQVIREATEAARRRMG
ncbi:MAG: hypothetical protein ABDH61_05455 [Acidilobaceae archaeon]